jgi:hypothetical protein
MAEPERRGDAQGLRYRSCQILTGSDSFKNPELNAGYKWKYAELIKISSATRKA